MVGVSASLDLASEDFVRASCEGLPAAAALGAPAGSVGPGGSTHPSTSPSSLPLHFSSSSQPSPAPSSSSSSSGSGLGGLLGGGNSSGSSSSSSSSEGLPGLSGRAGPGAGQQGNAEGSFMGGPFTMFTGSPQGEGWREEHLAYVLRRPVGGPSYITPLSVEQLVAAMASTARRCKVRTHATAAACARTHAGHASTSRLTCRAQAWILMVHRGQFCYYHQLWHAGWVREQLQHVG